MRRHAPAPEIVLEQGEVGLELACELTLGGPAPKHVQQPERDPSHVMSR